MTRDEDMIPNVLAERYASSAMRRIWSREEKVRRERLLWIAVMKAQSRLGVDISKEQIARYEQQVEKVDLQAIDERERLLKHDVKARIEEFNSLAGLQLIHLGLTSRDITENVELHQIRDSLRVIRSEAIGILGLLSERAKRHEAQVVVGRSHNIPAQLTTLGKRFASIAEELLFALERLDSLITRLPLRGLRGPMGTSQDLRDLVEDDVEELEQEVAKSLDFTRVLDATGQIYPRSIDGEVLSTLVQLSAAPSNLALMIRLMSGLGLVSEGFTAEQVGSSAMPHKVNPRSSERINGLTVLLKGYESMVTALSGNQWYEGDVSCSVVRRVSIPDAFFTLDGIFQTTATILKGMEVFEEAIRQEVEENLPLVATTKLLMAAVNAGMGREDAHRKIQEVSQSSLTRRKVGEKSDFLLALSEDVDFPLTSSDIERVLATLKRDCVAADQISAIQRRISAAIQSSTERENYFEEII